MIYSTINQGLRNPDLPSAVKEVLEYVKSHDIIAMSPGMHEIDGDRLYVNILDTVTLPEEQRSWEAHKDYLDVHVDFSGSEKIWMSFLENMDVKSYDKEGDWVQMSGNPQLEISLEPGQFAVFYPEDAHKTHIAFNESRPLKKGVFKIKIEK